MPHWMFEPLTKAPSRLGRELGESVDQPSMDRSKSRAIVEGFLAGALEGAGDVASDMTSPMSIASMALGPTAAGLKKFLSAPRAITSLGRISNTTDRMGDVLGEAQSVSNAARLGPEFVPLGGDDVFNAMAASRRLDDLADVALRAERGVKHTDVPLGPRSGPGNWTWKDIQEAMAGARRLEPKSKGVY